MKKLFLICLAILLSLHGTTFAKKNLPTEERINIAVEVTDNSRHKELSTAALLEERLLKKLVEKNLLNIVDTKNISEEVLDDAITAEENFPAEKLGDIIVFDAIELPAPSETPENFNQNFYADKGVGYVVRCEVLALGTSRVEDDSIGAIFGMAGGLTSFIGAWASGSTGKTLRRVGAGVGLGGFAVSERTALNTVVNMQFISVETGQILWQGNFMGQAVKHHKPYKGYKDAWTQAYLESLDKSAEVISKYVNKYVDKVIINGKSDKNFKDKKLSVGTTVGIRF